MKTLNFTPDLSLQLPSSPHFFAATSFCTQGLTWYTLALGRAQPPHRSFPSLNFHNTRVRRKPGGHVSNGLIERAQSTAPQFGRFLRGIARPIKH